MDKKQVINVANSFSYLASRRSKLERILAPYLVLCLDMRFFCHFDTISYGLFIVKKLTDLVTLAKVIHMREIFRRPGSNLFGCYATWARSLRSRGLGPNREGDAGEGDRDGEEQEEMREEGEFFRRDGEARSG